MPYLCSVFPRQNRILLKPAAEMNTKQVYEFVPAACHANKVVFCFCFFFVVFFSSVFFPTDLFSSSSHLGKCWLVRSFRSDVISFSFSASWMVDRVN